MTRLFEAARPIFFLSLALFFLTASAFFLRWTWMDDPVRAFTKALFEKDGQVIASVLGDPRTIRMLQALTGPSKESKEPPLAALLLDRLFADEGKLLRTLTSHLLGNPEVKGLLEKLVQTLREPSAGVSTAGPASSPDPLLLLGEKLGRYAVDQFLAKDSQALVGLIKALSPPSPSAVSSPPWSVQDIAIKIADPLGRLAIERFLKEDAKLLRTFIQALTSEDPRPLPVSQGSRSATSVPSITSVPSATSRPSASSASSASSFAPTDAARIQAEVIERLGRYIVDRLLEGRAARLRAIVVDLFGAEIMRTAREGRQIIEQITAQAQKTNVRQIVQDAAYSVGKGALDTFLQKQETEKREARRIQILLAEKRPLLKRLLQTLPCLVFPPEGWLQYTKDGLQVSLRVAARPECEALLCSVLTPSIREILAKELKEAPLRIEETRIQIPPICP